MKVLLSGASGFIGAPLSSFLSSQGHEIVSLSREKKATDSVFWDPSSGQAELNDFEGFDAVIHLGGDPLTLSRWSEEKKAKIFLSRTISTQFLSTILSNLKRPPKVFLCASAFGYYGDRGDEILTEQSGPGESFLAKVCVAWEKCARSVSNPNIRTVQMRFGIVLGPNGGALNEMLPLYRLGLGATLGSGAQWMSWISLHDLIRAIDWTLQTESLTGAINFVSPEPLKQRDFSKQLAKALHRPSFFSIPRALLRLSFGSVADDFLLASAKVIPQKLIASNFLFSYPDLRSALRDCLRTQV